MKIFDRLMGKEVPTKDELYVRDIINSFLEKDTCKLFYSPNSGKCFITDPDKEVNIMVKEGLVEITNHKFLYKRSLPLDFSKGLVDKVKDKISSNVEGIEKELFKNEIDLLRNILKDGE